MQKSEGESHSVVSDSLQPHGLSPWNSPGQITGVGILSLLQGIFPTQGLNPGLLHCRRIPYQLSHQESPRILDWVPYPFSSRSSQPRNWTRVSCIVGGFFTYWATREAHHGEPLSYFDDLKQSDPGGWGCLLQQWVCWFLSWSHIIQKSWWVTTNSTCSEQPVLWSWDIL